MKLCSNCKIKPDFIDRVTLANYINADVYQCPGCHQLVFYRPRQDWSGSNRGVDLEKAVKKYKENYPA